MSLLVTLLAVAVGGAAGSTARWGLKELWGAHLDRRERPGIAAELIPWPTLVANVLACYALGIIVTQLGSATGGFPRLAFLALSAGFCGGLSTLSTAAMDVVQLSRKGLPVIAVGYLLVSVGVGMVALWLGLATAQWGGELVS